MQCSFCGHPNHDTPLSDIGGALIGNCESCGREIGGTISYADLFQPLQGSADVVIVWQSNVRIAGQLARARATFPEMQAFMPAELHDAMHALEMVLGRFQLGQAMDLKAKGEAAGLHVVLRVIEEVQ